MITILATIFVLGVLIFIHELGHFAVAKWSGIRVEKFSLGFPPTLISKKKGETEYAIGVIPLGGYVKMAGENPGEETKGEPYEFMSKPVWKRFLVILAGPFMNFVLAVIVLAGLYLVRGKDMVTVGQVLEDGPAEQAGMKSGDVILSIDGIEIESFYQMANRIIYPRVEEPITVTWMRDGQKFTETIVTYKGWRQTGGDSIAVGQIGISPGFPKYEPLGFFGAMAAGFNQTIYYVEEIYHFVVGFFTQRTKASDLGGPVLIAQVAGEAARIGIAALLDFLALLSVNLAILNILPIPVLDGGHIVFLFLEKLKGSPVSIKARLVAQQIGMALLLVLVIYITFNDISRWTGG